MSDERKSKPILDEQSFSKLLEAAYVLQEHNRAMQAKNSGLEGDPLEGSESQDSGKLAANPAAKPTSSERIIAAEYGITLAKIVETQHDLQVRQLDLDSALKLVANRAVEITKARGASIGIVEGKVIRYRAVAGTSTPVAKSSDLPSKSLSAQCLNHGRVFRSDEVSAQGSFDSEACKKRGIGSMIAAPIFHDGKVAGSLELYHSTVRTFTDRDIHTCRLMAGLVTEALVRDEEISWKKSLADERAAMLEALEKLQPNLAALIAKPQEKATPPDTASAADARSCTCRKCGHELVREEQFCGHCGTPRASDYEPPSMQSKLASLWQLQESHKQDVTGDAKGVPEFEKSFSESVSKKALLEHPVDEQVLEILAQGDEIIGPVELASPLIDAEDFATAQNETSSADEQQATGEELKPSEALVPTSHTHQAQWGSAASARAFLQQLTTVRDRRSLLKLWNTHRGDIYLVIAVLLVACVVGWGLWSDHSPKAKGTKANANATHRKAPDSDLSFFDRILIELGLAEAPPAPEDKGNPAVQVWVDLQTALYYCPGTDLYGKTSKGKFTTQRAAQLDQFEPAYRKACK